MFDNFNIDNGGYILKQTATAVTFSLICYMIADAKSNFDLLLTIEAVGQPGGQYGQVILLALFCQ